MTDLENVAILLPKDAFHKNPQTIKLVVGKKPNNLRDFVNSTRAHYVCAIPIYNPTTYHFSKLPCNHQNFTQEDIITVNLDKHGTVTQIRIRKPFGSK